MDARLSYAPETPAFLGFELGKRQGQVVGRVPLVEFLPQWLFDH